MSTNGTSTLSLVQEPFIENWGTLADAWGMDRAIGRIHALVYVSVEPVRRSQIAERLCLSPERCENALRELTAWGVVRPLSGPDDTDPRYEAEPDPWTWFFKSIRERRRREFVPVLMSIRNVRDYVRQVRDEFSGSASQREQLDAIYSRVDRFTRFVEDIARLVDTFASLGVGPMVMAARTAARLVPASRRER